MNSLPLNFLPFYIIIKRDWPRWLSQKQAGTIVPRGGNIAARCIKFITRICFGNSPFSQRSHDGSTSKGKLYSTGIPCAVAPTESDNRDSIVPLIILAFGTGRVFSRVPPPVCNSPFRYVTLTNPRPLEPTRKRRLRRLSPSDAITFRF